MFSLLPEGNGVLLPLAERFQDIGARIPSAERVWFGEPLF